MRGVSGSKSIPVEGVQNRQVDLARIGESFWSVHHRWEITGSDIFERSIVSELSRRLPHIDPSSWPARFDLGGVYLAGQQASISHVISPPCRLEYYEPKVPLEHVRYQYAEFSPHSILYADEDLLIVIKPARLPTTPSRDQSRYNLQRYLTEHFGRAVHLPSRLDSAVHGIVLCSLSSRMNRYCQKGFEKRWFEKYYVAEVEGAAPKESLLVEFPIARDPLHPVLRKCVEQGGEKAETRITLIPSCIPASGKRHLIQAEPLTGRTHQIRLHCQALGIPIVGDPYYGGAESDELRLVSYALRFHHPYRREMVTFKLPKTCWPEWLAAAVGGDGDDINLSYRSDRQQTARTHRD